MKHVQPGYRHRARAAPSSPRERISRLSLTQALDRITRTRLDQKVLDAELAALIDHAVTMRVGWRDAFLGRQTSADVEEMVDANGGQESDDPAELTVLPPLSTSSAFAPPVLDDRMLARLHLAAQPFGPGMMGPLEDLKRLLPQLASRLNVAGRLVSVAEVNQHLGAIPDRTELRVHRCREFVAADRCLVLAEQVPHIAEAVPGGRGDHPVIDVLGESQGLLAAGEALFGVT
jgi:hypothetical protein